MMIKKMFYLIAIAATLVTTSCEKDDDITVDPGEKTGKLALEITDAPIDQPNVSAVFVTIADVKIDGQSISGFQKFTVDLLDLQNGKTQSLGNITLSEKSYGNLTLVLDHSADAQGNSPGSYVVVDGSTKHGLSSDMNELSLDYDFDIMEDSTVTLVMDFDLRKSIVRNTDSTASSQFSWTDVANFNNALRIVNKTEASVLKGMCNQNTDNSDAVVAYVYAAGSFNADSEVDTTGQGIAFSNAISSALVNENNEYAFHFLAPGNYEVQFAGYEWDDTNQELQLSGLLDIETSTDIDLGNINIGAGTETSVDVSITGLLGL